jgi:hypothetical protein
MHEYASALNDISVAASLQVPPFWHGRDAQTSPPEHPADWHICGHSCSIVVPNGRGGFMYCVTVGDHVEHGPGFIWKVVAYC